MIYYWVGFIGADPDDPGPFIVFELVIWFPNGWSGWACFSCFLNRLAWLDEAFTLELSLGVSQEVGELQWFMVAVCGSCRHQSWLTKRFMLKQWTFLIPGFTLESTTQPGMEARSWAESPAGWCGNLWLDTRNCKVIYFDDGCSTSFCMFTVGNYSNRSLFWLILEGWLTAVDLDCSTSSVDSAGTATQI
jgi:hypothetical protein